MDEDYGTFRYLPYYVEGFFLNGGRKVYIIRVSHEKSSQTEKIASEPSIVCEDSRTASNRTGLHALKNIDEVSLVSIPNGTSQRIQKALIEHCELMKNRFAVLDSVTNTDLEQIKRQRSLIDSKYGALYYPWINIRDSISGKVLSIPPAGIYVAFLLETTSPVAYIKHPHTRI